MKVKPIIPFEPTTSEKIPIGSEWIFQIKWDGVRILSYFDGQEVKLYNRKLNDRTKIFPELTDMKSYMSADSIILDGEVIALDTRGNPSFHEVMKRDGIRRVERVEKVRQEVPIFYMIFDIIYVNGKWIHDHPLEERLKVLHETIRPNPTIQLVPVEKDGEALFEVVKQHGLEGIVCKNLNSKYAINAKNSNWLKVKNYRDVIAVIGGVTYRDGIVNSMLLGLYDEDEQLHFIGHAGTGKLTREEWLTFTRSIEPLEIQKQPFLNNPPRIKDVQWLNPILTVKVQYIEWPKGHSLRQPSIQAFVNQDPKSCRIQE